MIGTKFETARGSCDVLHGDPFIHGSGKRSKGGLPHQTDRVGEHRDHRRVPGELQRPVDGLII